MTDDKRKRDFRDRDGLSASEDYEVPPEEVRKLIRLHGNDRKTLDRAARKLRP